MGMKLLYQCDRCGKDMTQEDFGFKEEIEPILREWGANTLLEIMESKGEEIKTCVLCKGCAMEIKNAVLAIRKNIDKLTPLGKTLYTTSLLLTAANYLYSTALSGAMSATSSLDQPHSSQAI